MIHLTLAHANLVPEDVAPPPAAAAPIPDPPKVSRSMFSAFSYLMPPAPQAPANVSTAVEEEPKEEDHEKEAPAWPNVANDEFMSADEDAQVPVLTEKQQRKKDRDEKRSKKKERAELKQAEAEAPPVFYEDGDVEMADISPNGVLEHDAFVAAPAPPPPPPPIYALF